MKSSDLVRTQKAIFATLLGSALVLSVTASAGAEPAAGGQDNFVPTTICHHAGPDQLVTITVDNAAVFAAHLAHGDTIGACPSAPTATPSPTQTPATSSATPTTVPCRVVGEPQIAVCSVPTQIPGPQATTVPQPPVHTFSSGPEPLRETGVSASGGTGGGYYPGPSHTHGGGTLNPPGPWCDPDGPANGAGCPDHTWERPE